MGIEWISLLSSIVLAVASVTAVFVTLVIRRINLRNARIERTINLHENFLDPIFYQEVRAPAWRIRMQWFYLPSSAANKAYRTVVCNGWSAYDNADKFTYYVSEHPKSEQEAVTHHYHVAHKPQGLTEHQSLTSLLRFWTRLNTHRTKGLLDDKLLNNLFYDEFDNQRSFFAELAACISRRNDKIPLWVNAIAELSEFFDQGKKQAIVSGREESTSSARHKWILIGIGLFALVTITVTISFYFSSFNGDLSFDQAVWGTFGDFMGGTLNPILSFLSLLAILYTIHIQNKELQLTRQELRQSRKAQENQANNVQDQLNHLEQQEKRHLTFQMLARWNSLKMGKDRRKAWKYLEARFKKKKVKLNIYKFSSQEEKCFEAFAQVCFFFSDLNKILNEGLVEQELTVMLFKESVQPWFRYTDGLRFKKIHDDPESVHYDLNVEQWYRSKVMSLKNHFI